MQRSAVVTPSAYGTDSHCMLDTFKRLGPNARGVVVVDTSVVQTQLTEMHATGMRVIRFNLSYPGATTVDMLAPLAPHIGALGWCVELVVQGARLPALESYLFTLSYPFAIDHIVHVPQPGGMQPDVTCAAQRLVDKGNMWITLSGLYVDSKVGASAYAGVEPVARVFIDMMPERVLWGIDWPYPIEKAHKSDDVTLVNMLVTWIGHAD